MATESQIDKLEERLSTLSRQCREQDTTAKQKLQDNESAIKTLLRNGIATVQTLIDSPVLALENDAHLVPKNGALVTTTPLTIARACDDACAAFEELSKSADRYLEDVMSMQLEVIEFEAELARLQRDLDGAATKVLGATSDVEESLRSKESELQTAQQELETSTREMTALSNKLESNKDKRNILRVGRAAAWIVTPFFPPMAGVAIGMEAGNLVLKDDKANLKSRINTANETQQKVNQAIARLRLNKETLRSSLDGNLVASQRCRTLAGAIKLSKEDLVAKEGDYQTLKDAAGKFVLWANDLDSHALLLGDSDDTYGIAKATKLLVDEIAKVQGGAMQGVCDALRPAPCKAIATADHFAWIQIRFGM